MGNTTGTFAGYTPGGIKRIEIKRAVNNTIKAQAEARKAKAPTKRGAYNTSSTDKKRLQLCMQVVDKLLSEKCKHGVFTLTDAEIAAVTGESARYARTLKETLSKAGVVTIRKRSSGLGERGTLTLWWVDKNYIQWNKTWISHGRPNTPEESAKMAELDSLAQSGEITIDEARERYLIFMAQNMDRENRAARDAAVKKHNRK